MKIVDVEVRVIRLPFRFSFRHSLASRNSSENVIVSAVVEDGGRRQVGFGEGIPRDYVTGEDVAYASEVIRERYLPRFLGTEYGRMSELCAALSGEFRNLRLQGLARGASWCAMELAVLDAAAKLENRTVAACLGGVNQGNINGIRYGGTIPFAKKRAFSAILWFYRLFGFQTVKIKVGTDWDGDYERVARARQILGPDVTLRLDANCAWTAEQTLRCAERFRKFKVASYEQPVAADDLEGMARISRSIPEQVLADESLCSIEQAQTLASQRICTAFNIRVSKVGGLLAAGEIANIARGAGIAVHMGAQVGESGILSGAGRCFASMQPPLDNYEGSSNLFLLQQDLTRENLNVGYGGTGKLLTAPGLGVTVLPERLHRLTVDIESTQRLRLRPVEAQSNRAKR
jgi:muconate cycloisomerase